MTSSWLVVSGVIPNLTKPKLKWSYGRSKTTQLSVFNLKRLCQFFGDLYGHRYLVSSLPTGTHPNPTFDPGTSTTHHTTEEKKHFFSNPNPNHQCSAHPLLADVERGMSTYSKFSSHSPHHTPTHPRTHTHTPTDTYSAKSKSLVLNS